METYRVLIVCDTPDRVNFLSHHIRLHHMKPIRYPNALSSMQALKRDTFRMVVVDLTLPIGGKIELIKAACIQQENAEVLAIGKTLYLETAGLLNDFPSVKQISDIQAFPDRLKALESIL